MNEEKGAVETGSRFDVALGIKYSEEPQVIHQNEVEVRIFLRHDKTSDHWAGIECARFGNLASSLMDAVSTSCDVPQDEPFREMLKEILAEKDATSETLRRVNDTAFADWLCRCAFQRQSTIHRGHFTFRIRIVNQFPLTEEGGCIQFVSQAFQKNAEKHILLQAPSQIIKKIRNFRDEWNGRKLTEVTMGINEAFCALSLPVHDSEFGITDIDETRGDDSFRYIAIELGLGCDTIVRLVAKQSLDICGLAISLYGREILKWSGKWHLPPREEIAIKCMDAPLRVADFIDALTCGLQSFTIAVFMAGGKVFKQYEQGMGDTSVLSVAIHGHGGKVNVKYASLFIDMGSTFSKMLIVETDKTGRLQPSSIRSESKCYEPTAKFLSTRHLDDSFRNAMKMPPGADVTDNEIVLFKRRMSGEPEKFAGFLSEAVRRLARYYFECCDVILDSVSWSFPKTGRCPNSFFVDVEKVVRREIVGYTRKNGEGAFRLYPEHEALRLMFDFAIKGIAHQAEYADRRYEQKTALSEKNRLEANNMAEKDRETILKDNRKSGFFGFWRNQEAKLKAYIMTRKLIRESNERATQEKQEAFSELMSLKWRTDALLLLWCAKKQGAGHGSFVFIDAGGYSLDSVAEVDGVPLEWLTRSFEAGGEELIRQICCHLKFEYDNHSREIVRTGLAKGSYCDERWFSDVFSEVYGQYAAEFKERILSGDGKEKKKEIDYMVLSGGVANNEMFRGLFTPKLLQSHIGIFEELGEKTPLPLRKATLDAPKLSTKSLFSLVKEISEDYGINDASLDVFRRVATDTVRDERNLLSDGEPCEKFDVVGGMLQDAIARSNR